MMISRFQALLASVALIAAAAEIAQAEAGEFLLIDRALQVTPVHVAEINRREIIVLTDAGIHETIPHDRCIALLRTEPGAVEMSAGVLLLNDGQRLPGQLSASTPSQPNTMTWIHPWLAPINVPLDRVRALRLAGHELIPEPRAADVVLMENGDRIEGFVTAIGEVIAVEVDIDGRPQTVRVPFERVASLALVTPDRQPTGTRVWFAGATVLDVQELSVGDDGYIRYIAALTGRSADPISVRLPAIEAILFEAEAMRPLADVAPAQIDATVPRFFVPEPRVLDEQAALGLNRIEYRGPMLVRYPLPRGVVRFAAEAVLPANAREWGDFELIVRDDDRTVFRARLNASRASVPINVELRGSELTIEIAEGARGPIQDRLVLERAILLIE
jgi:hypothetical protein